MPAAISTPLRRRIWLLTRSGQSVAAIALNLNLSPRTVRHLVQRVQELGTPALTAQYGHCGRPASPQPPPLVQEALDLRADHPTWGAVVVRLFLRRRHPRAVLPSARTLQRWFRRSRAPKALPGRRPTDDTPRAGSPHEGWQMDAADQVRLQTKRMICWLRLVDECSGAFLRTVVFPPELLGARPRRPGATGLAAGFPRVGTPPAAARGQRQALGIVERSAAAFGLVAARPGHRHDLDPAPSSSAQRCGRTQPRDGQALGRT